MIQVKDYIYLGGMAKVSDIRKYGLLRASGYTEEDFNWR